MRRWVGPRGWAVELISLDRRPVLRAKQHGCLVGECASVPELETLLRKGGLSMAILVEALPGRT